MVDVKEVLLTKDYFTKEGEIQIPPYHPSMKDGIDLDLVYELAPLIFRGTLEDLSLYSEDNRGKFHVERGEDSLGRYLIISDLGGISLRIEPDQVKNANATQSMMLPSALTEIMRREKYDFSTYKPFSDLLKLEYEAELVRQFPSGDFWMRSPHVWYTHNLTPKISIALLNFVVIYNNAVVKRKYSQ